MIFFIEVKLVYLMCLFLLLIISGCLEEYFEIANDKGKKPAMDIFSGCKSVMHSKSSDESLV